MDVTFAIVGTAGRKDDAKRLTSQHYSAMCECARNLYQQLSSSYSKIILVSGGAAFADHVAVQLFLEKLAPGLKLFFPAPFLVEKNKFDETGRVNNEGRRFNDGVILNQYHRSFSTKISRPSLQEISRAIEMGAETHVSKGFFARNALVAKSDIILAMTFGNKEYLKEGGTAHTVKCYLDRVRREGFFDKSFHYDLNSNEVFMGAQVRESTVAT